MILIQSIFCESEPVTSVLPARVRPLPLPPFSPKKHAPAFSRLFSFSVFDLADKRVRARSFLTLC